MNEVLVWYKIIYGWCLLKTPRGNGVTIPYVVGALDDYTIADLLVGIRDTETEEKVILQYCSDRHEHILSVDDPAYPIAHTLPKKHGHLYLYDDTVEALSTFEDLIHFLDGKYSGFIADGNYSINPATNEWGPYSTADLAFINRVLGL